MVRNNARIGAQIAVANSQQQLMQQSQSPRRSFSTSAFASASTSTPSTARDGLSATKCSRRDLARVLSQKDLGATTVSGTMIASKLAGIDVFVTGGIGGVHRGVEDTMDVSADLTELARTPVVVVCAGVKSILDIPRTLEYLETQGVAVMCWQTDRFPAFFTVDSGEKAPIRIDQATEVAEWIEANQH